MTRLSRLPLLRALAGIAIAIASPGLELGHGLAHAHEREHQQALQHRDDVVAPAADHAGEHPHLRVTQAPRIRADMSAFVPLAAKPVVLELPVSRVVLTHPGADSPFSEDRATGPPPSLRAPPVD